MFRSVSKVLSDMMGGCVVPPPSVHLCSHLLWFRRWSQRTAGQCLQRWAAGTSVLNVQPLLPSSAKQSPKTTCLPGTLRPLHLPPRQRHYVFNNASHLFLSKIESRLQRRPRSTSMKDRQNSKAQSDRTSSMESECSPESRLVAQVRCYSGFF